MGEGDDKDAFQTERGKPEPELADGRSCKTVNTFPRKAHLSWHPPRSDRFTLSIDVRTGLVRLIFTKEALWRISSAPLNQQMTRSPPCRPFSRAVLRFSSRSLPPPLLSPLSPSPVLQRSLLSSSTDKPKSKTHHSPPFLDLFCLSPCQTQLSTRQPVQLTMLHRMPFDQHHQQLPGINDTPAPGPSVASGSGSSHTILPPSTLQSTSNETADAPSGPDHTKTAQTEEKQTFWPLSGCPIHFP